LSGPLQRLAAQGAAIERLTSDSRRCAPGAAFFAYPGEKADGRAYIADATRRGASGVVWEADAWRVHPLVNTATLVIARPDVERFLASTGHVPNVVDVPVRAA